MPGTKVEGWSEGFVKLGKPIMIQALAANYDAINDYG